MAGNEDHWHLKEYRPGDSDQRWFFRKNLAPAIAICDPKYESIAYLTFAYLPDDASGLPSSGDEKTLFYIEDVELRDFEADELAVHVASVTKDGVNDFLFYTRDADEFLRRAKRFHAAYPQFQVGCQISPDPEWSHYEEFP